MNLTQAQPLFALARSTYYEVVIHGIAAFIYDDGTLTGTAGDPALVTRSLLKPWQYLATGLAGIENYWAMAIASHDGDEMHLHALSQLADAQQITQHDLYCPECYPMADECAWRLKLDGQPSSKIYHPCSGKHMAMAAACRMHGWPSNYTTLEHPIHKRLDQLVCKAGVVGGEWLIDSCGLPTLAAPISQIAAKWRSLCFDDSEPASRLKQLWSKNAQLIGGKNRLDSKIIASGKGQLIAKEGADGLLAVFSLPERDQSVQGCIIKLTSGYNSRYLGLALWNLLMMQREGLNPSFRALLDQLELAKNEWIPKDQVLVANPV